MRRKILLLLISLILVLSSCTQAADTTETTTVPKGNVPVETPPTGWSPPPEDYTQFFFETLELYQNVLFHPEQYTTHELYATKDRYGALNAEMIDFLVAQKKLHFPMIGGELMPMLDYDEEGFEPLIWETRGWHGELPDVTYRNDDYFVMISYLDAFETIDFSQVEDVSQIWSLIYEDEASRARWENTVELQLADRTVKACYDRMEEDAENGWRSDWYVFLYDRILVTVWTKPDVATEALWSGFSIGEMSK